jgi:hypothetical protein
MSRPIKTEIPFTKFKIFKLDHIQFSPFARRFWPLWDAFKSYEEPGGTRTVATLSKVAVGKANEAGSHLKTRIHGIAMQEGGLALQGAGVATGGEAEGECIESGQVGEGIHFEIAPGVFHGKEFGGLGREENGGAGSAARNWRTN